MTTSFIKYCTSATTVFSFPVRQHCCVRDEVMMLGVYNFYVSIHVTSEEKINANYSKISDRIFVETKTDEYIIHAMCISYVLICVTPFYFIIVWTMF